MQTMDYMTDPSQPYIRHTRNHDLKSIAAPKGVVIEKHLASVRP